MYDEVLGGVSANKKLWSFLITIYAMGAYPAYKVQDQNPCAADCGAHAGSRVERYSQSYKLPMLMALAETPWWWFQTESSGLKIQSSPRLLEESVKCD